MHQKFIFVVSKLQDFWYLEVEMVQYIYNHSGT